MTINEVPLLIMGGVSLFLLCLFLLSDANSEPDEGPPYHTGLEDCPCEECKTERIIEAYRKRKKK